MNWGRAKTILIILFLCTNTFLLTAIILSSNNSSVVSEAIAKSTVDILKDNGIDVSEEIIPRRTDILPVVNVISGGFGDERKFLTVRELKKIIKDNKLQVEEVIGEVKSVAGVLVDFVSEDREKNVKITALEQGYSARVVGENVIFVPSWKIVTEKGTEYVMVAG